MYVPAYLIMGVWRRSYDTVPDGELFARGSGTNFEKKLVPPMDSFTALCRAHLSSEEAETLYGWTALVPASLEPEIHNLDLTSWFMDGPAKELATHQPGPWSADLDAAFYVALYLRAAQYSLRRNCPLAYS